MNATQTHKNYGTAWKMKHDDKRTSSDGWEMGRSRIHRKTEQ
jgi:hypothetical protein